MKDLRRFWRKAVWAETDCLEWTASLDTGGYGSFWFDGRLQRAHRVSWQLHCGPLPEGSGYHGACVLHRCDNRKCVNPTHLFVGTQQDNVDDQISKSRFADRGGDRNGRAKLTTEQVLAISQDRRSLKEIAAQYAIGTSAVSDIRSGRRWSHVTQRRNRHDC